VPKKVTVKRLTFEVALRHVLNQEGGVSNDPNDAGGLTKRGISTSFYQGLVKNKGYKNKLVTELTNAEIEAIYRKWFWEASGANRIENPALALQVFDFAVNASVTTASRFFNNGNTTPLAYNKARIKFYKSRLKCPIYCDGWIARANRTYQKGLELS
jgi:lysozyme family protein